MKKLKARFENALNIFTPELQDRLSSIMIPLFDLCFEDLNKAEITNPLPHHPVVFSHMMLIAQGEDFSQADIKRAGAIAVMHDISAVEKITEEHVELACKRSKQEGDTLRLEMEQNRILHMREGSGIANRRMLELNRKFNTILFDAQDIEIICEVIRIHDNPSIGIPIRNDNYICVAFREADRLWMLTREGIDTDLDRKIKRKEIDHVDTELRRRQFDSNFNRFKDERTIYSPDDGPFIDSSTFFRTRKGWEICQQYLKDRDKICA